MLTVVPQGGFLSPPRIAGLGIVRRDSC
jgi:hypothetical protein